jgi:hypothetical protein
VMDEFAKLEFSRGERRERERERERMMKLE